MSKIARRTKSGPKQTFPQRDEVVRDLETIEEIRRLLKKQLAQTAKALRDIEAEPKSARARTMRGPLSDHYDAVAKLLNTLNDSKWASIVLRAEMNRGERGPTFDDPEKLRKYLAAN